MLLRAQLLRYSEAKEILFLSHVIIAIVYHAGATRRRRPSESNGVR